MQRGRSQDGAESFRSRNVCNGFGFCLKLTAHAFPLPQDFHRASAASPRTATAACHAFPPSSFLPPSAILGADNEIADVAVGLEDAFTDEFDVLSDPKIQTMFAGFGVFVVVALVAKSLLGRMDSAIAEVLSEFEETMRRNYASRWVSIEAKLEGLVEPERSQRLFEIMEGLQRDEPEFMAEVNQDMAK